jgi:probable F420-dependent oxidoreductase
MSTLKTADIHAVRHVLGPVGAFLPYPMPTASSISDQCHDARRLEHAGYGAVGTNEVPGKDSLVQLSILLAATQRVVFGTAIANIWSRAPHTAHGASTMLARAFPDRFVLGLGVGHPAQAGAIGRKFTRPVGMMRDYLQQMSAPTPGSVTDTPYPRLLAANGPKMFALAGENADGAIPAMIDPAVTSQARDALGVDKLLVILIDASNEAGDLTDVATTVTAHRSAGADHVVALLPIGTELAAGINRLEQLAPALLHMPPTNPN